MVHIRAIASTPHMAGTPADAAAREYLLSQMQQLDLSPRAVRTVTVAFGRLIVLNNLIGRLPGTSAGPALLLCCHYDSAPVAPGAGDDGAAVGALLETMRALKAGPPVRNDVVLLITDGEELGLRGAWGMTHEGRAELPNIGLVLNFDARGTRGPSILYETSGGNETLVRQFASAAPDPFGTSLGADVKKRMPNDTDFTIFRMAGYRGLNFAFIDNYVYYHTPNDTIANLDRRTVYHTGSYALALARNFGNQDLRALRQTNDRDAVFFNPFRGVMIVYGTRWIWPINGLLLVAAVAAIAAAARQRRVRAGGIFMGLAAMILCILASATADWGLWTLAHVALRNHWLASTPGFILRPSPTPDEVMGLMIASSAIAIIVTLIVILGLRRFISSEAIAAAGAIVWTLLAIAAGIWLPGGTYLAAWPALFAVGAFILTLIHRDNLNWTHAALILAASAPTLLLLPPSIQLFFAALTVQNAFVVAPLIVLAVWLLATSGCLEILLPMSQERF